MIAPAARAAGAAWPVVKGPARRPREVAVEQRLELRAVVAIDAGEVGQRIGGAAGPVFLDELLQEVLRIRHCVLTG